MQKCSPAVLQVLVLAGIGLKAFSQQSSRGPSCNLAAVGEGDTQAFRIFDKELKAALLHEDAVAMSFLVWFPLRINDIRGSIYLHDSPSLQARFKEIFPVPLRTEVLQQRIEGIHCSYAGVMYGDGLLRANPHGEHYKIDTINLPLKPVHRTSGRTPDLEFTGETETHRIVIDSKRDGVPRYRAWSAPRAVTDKPDLEIGAGKTEYSGTGPCRHKSWTFLSGSNKYVVEEMGCTSNSDPPPEGTKGTLHVFAGEKELSFAWFY